MWVHGGPGTGKTTTVEILEGLLDPTAGDVEVLGMRWSSDERALRGRIGVSLQQTHLPERLTVAEGRHEADLRGALKNTDPTSAAAKTPAPNAAEPNVPPGTTPAEPQDSSSVDPSVLGTADDYQLARALDMLRGVALFNGRVSN